MQRSLLNPNHECVSSPSDAPLFSCSADGTPDFRETVVFWLWNAGPALPLVGNLGVHVWFENMERALASVLRDILWAEHWEERTHGLPLDQISSWYKHSRSLIYTESGLLIGLWQSHHISPWPLWTVFQHTLRPKGIGFRTLSVCVFADGVLLFS